MDFLYNSLRFGELSPEFNGRTDLPEFYQGCRSLEGFVVPPTGGAERRPGFELVGWTNGGASIGGEL